MRLGKLVLPAYIFLLAFLLVVSGCAPSVWKNANRAYKQGDMVRAVEYSVQTLRQKHGYKKAVNLLKSVLEPTYENLYSDARRAGNLGDWDNAYQKYRTIERISGMVSTLPEQPDPGGGTIKFPSMDVRDEVDYAIRQAAEMHYQDGRDLQRQARYREAARAYTMSMSYVLNYRDASERYNTSREAAMQRVAVFPFENLTGQPLYGSLGEIIADHTVANILADRRNLEFLDILTRNRLQALLAENKVVISASLSEQAAVDIGDKIGIHSLVLGKIHSVGFNYHPEKIDIIHEEATVSGGRNESRDTVHATVTITTRRTQARMVASYQIIDVMKGATVRTGTIPQEVEIVIEFASFRGDARALSNRSRRLVNTEPAYPPPENELVLHLTELLSQNLSREIVRFFN